MNTNMRIGISAMIAGIMVIVLSGCSSDDAIQDLRTSSTFSLESVYVNTFTDYNKSVTRNFTIPYNAELLRSGKLSVSAIGITSDAADTNERECNVCYDYDPILGRWVIDKQHATNQNKVNIKLTTQEKEIIAFYPHQLMLPGDRKDYVDYVRASNGAQITLRKKPRIKMYARLYNNDYNAATRVGRFRADMDNPVRVQTLEHIYSLLSLRFVRQESHKGEDGSVTQITLKDQPKLKSDVDKNLEDDFWDNKQTAVYHLAEDRIELRPNYNSDNTFSGLPFKCGEGVTADNQAHILMVPQPMSGRPLNMEITVDGTVYRASIPASYFQNQLLQGVQYRFKVLVGEKYITVVADDFAPVINDWDDSPDEIQAGEVSSTPN